MRVSFGAIAITLLLGPFVVPHASAETYSSRAYGVTYALDADGFNPHYGHPALWKACSHTLPVGGSCFFVPPISQARVTLVGPAGFPAAGWLAFVGPGNASLGGDFVCGDSGWIGVPPGTHIVDVLTIDAALSVIVCYGAGGTYASGLVTDITLRTR